MAKELQLSKGMVAQISDEDYERCARYKWCATNCPQGAKKYGKRREDRKPKWYAKRKERLPDGSYRFVYLHRFIMQAPVGVLVDHRNGDGLDCRRENLRLVTAKVNSQTHNRNNQENGPSL